MWQQMRRHRRNQKLAQGKDKRSAPRVEIPFKRVRASIRNEATGETIGGRVFLSDLSVKGVGLFLESAIPNGLPVTVTIESEEPFSVRGRVVWCAPYTLSLKVLSVEAFTYRAGVRFEYNTSVEVFRVKDCCDRLLASVRPAWSHS